MQRNGSSILKIRVLTGFSSEFSFTLLGAASLKSPNFYIYEYGPVDDTQHKKFNITLRMVQVRVQYRCVKLDIFKFSCTNMENMTLFLSVKYSNDIQILLHTHIETLS